VYKYDLSTNIEIGHGDPCWNVSPLLRAQSSSK